MSSAASTVAVIGGSRFVGRAIVEALLQHGHRLITINRGLSPVEYPGQVERVVADRTDSASFESVLRQVRSDWVVDVTAYCEEHTRTAVNALQGRIRGFIHISTLSVYRWPFPCPVTESWPLETDPANEYGFHKAECERVLHAASGFPWTSLRLPAVFGPHDPVSREGYLLGNLLRGRPIMVPVKPFLCQNICVQDVAAAVHRLIENTGKHRERAYNIGGHPFTLEEYVNRMGRIIGREPCLIQSKSETLRAANADPGRLPYFFEGDLMMDTSPIKDAAGFVPKFTLDRGLSTTIDWLVANPRQSTYWGLPWERSMSGMAQCT
ncbi:MAG: NAD-dependent epimerase/dehydratase family protein [Syntrophobacter sp.]